MLFKYHVDTVIPERGHLKNILCERWRESERENQAGDQLGGKAAAGNGRARHQRQHAQSLSPRPPSKAAGRN